MEVLRSDVLLKPADLIKDDLDKLKSAPLKPSQRLFALKAFILPKTYYHLAMGNVAISELRKVDKLVRICVRC